MASLGIRKGNHTRTLHNRILMAPTLPQRSCPVAMFSIFIVFDPGLNASKAALLGALIRVAESRDHSCCIFFVVDAACLRLPRKNSSVLRVLRQEQYLDSQLILATRWLQETNPKHLAMLIINNPRRMQLLRGGCPGKHQALLFNTTSSTRARHLHGMHLKLRLPLNLCLAFLDSMALMDNGVSGVWIPDGLVTSLRAPQVNPRPSQVTRG